jgi:hypothetical protein
MTSTVFASCLSGTQTFRWKATINMRKAKVKEDTENRSKKWSKTGSNSVQEALSQQANLQM